MNTLATPPKSTWFLKSAIHQADTHEHALPAAVVDRTVYQTLEKVLDLPKNVREANLSYDDGNTYLYRKSIVPPDILKVLSGKIAIRFFKAWKEHITKVSREEGISQFVLTNNELDIVLSIDVLQNTRYRYIQINFMLGENLPIQVVVNTDNTALEITQDVEAAVLQIVKDIVLTIPQEPIDHRVMLEQHEYDTFSNAFRKDPKYRHLRFGQAFYQHFKLDRMAKRDEYDVLYERDSHRAVALINQLFVFN